MGVPLACIRLVIEQGTIKGINVGVDIKKRFPSRVTGTNVFKRERREFLTDAVEPKKCCERSGSARGRSL